MFDLTSSKLLLLGIVALIVIGPKDLPLLLRTVGKYMGMIRRQANEFRAQFDDAMRETELDQLKKEVEAAGRDAETTFRDAERSVNTDLAMAEADVNASITAHAPTVPPQPALLPSAEVDAVAVEAVPAGAPHWAAAAAAAAATEKTGA